MTKLIKKEYMEYFQQSLKKRKRTKCVEPLYGGAVRKIESIN